MNKQKASLPVLSFLRRGKREELSTSIDEVEKRISRIETAEEIQLKYQMEINRLREMQREETEKIEDEVSKMNPVLSIMKYKS